jgi:hypothetical protein
MKHKNLKITESTLFVYKKERSILARPTETEPTTTTITTLTTTTGLYNRNLR